MDKIALWQATAEPGCPTVPPTGMDDNREAVRLLDIDNMKGDITFKRTPDDVLFNFLQASGNPTVNKRNNTLHALKTLRFDTHMVGQWAIDRWKRIDTSNRI
jgi:hypothetical protein